MLSLPDLLEHRAEWARREKFLSNCQDPDSFPKYYEVLSWYDKSVARKYREAIEEGVFENLQLKEVKTV